MKNKWFWATFSAWIFLGINVTAWPLIYSPLFLSKRKISEFDVEANGIKQNHQLWISSSPIETYEKEVTGQWRKEGWLPIHNKLDLTPYLLEIENSPSIRLDCLKIKTFQKNSFLKILGLWNSNKERQTYGWVAELPIKEPKDKQGLATYSFPLKPPSNTLNVYWGKTKSLQFACWSLSPRPHPEEQFREVFSSQGFNGRLWDRGSTEATYLLEKGSMRLVAFLKSGVAEVVISLMIFDKK